MLDFWRYNAKIDNYADKYAPLIFSVAKTGKKSRKTTKTNKIARLVKFLSIGSKQLVEKLILSPLKIFTRSVKNVSKNSHC